MNRYQVCLVAIVVILGFLLAGLMDYKSMEEGQEHYCKMIEMYDVSNGREGWPPFNGRCEK